MYVITDLRQYKSIVGNCIKPLADSLNIDHRTIKAWLKEPQKALLKGYIVTEGIEIKSNRGSSTKYRETNFKKQYK